MSLFCWEGLYCFINALVFPGVFNTAAPISIDNYNNTDPSVVIKPLNLSALVVVLLTLLTLLGIFPPLTLWTLLLTLWTVCVVM